MPEKISVKHYLLDLYLYLTHNSLPRKQNVFINKLCARFSLKNKNILDIGSSTAYYSFYFSCHKNKVTGIEPSDAYYYASKRFKKFNIEFIKDNINYIYTQIECETFDFIFCSNLPLHYDTGKISSSRDFKFFIQNILQFIKPGGVLYYCFYATAHDKVTHHVSIDELKIVLEENAIEHYELKTITPIDYPMVELVLYKN